ncbi:putative alpha crystallin/Hsp20 domain, HSP20-like chaperone [Helianthus debilis subsp. tardiflorus]
MLPSFLFVGFTKEFIKVTIENPNILHVLGQRLIPGNKWHWFHEDFQVPETCKVNVIRAKFDGGILTITMPHKFINPPTIQEPMKRETQDTKSTKPISSIFASTIPSQPPLNNATKPSNESKNSHMSLDQAMGRIKDERKVIVKMEVVAMTVVVVAVALVAVGIYMFPTMLEIKV